MIVGFPMVQRRERGRSLPSHSLILSFILLRIGTSLSLEGRRSDIIHGYLSKTSSIESIQHIPRVLRQSDEAWFHCRKTRVSNR